MLIIRRFSWVVPSCTRQLYKDLELVQSISRRLRGCSVAPPLRIWRLHIVTEPELKYEYEGVVR